MAEYETEEQQVEALKQWWADNGKAIIFGIVLGLAAIFGWRGWQSHQVSVSQDASAAYTEIMSALAQDDVGEEFLSQVAAIKADHGSSSYAAMASLAQARYHVQNDDLPAASTALRWTIEEGGFDELRSIARLRLARVLKAQGKADEALALLDQVKPQAYSGLAEEIRGDVYLASGKPEQAREAYLRAQGSGSTTVSNENLQMKIDDLAQPDAEETGDGQS